MNTEETKLDAQGNSIKPLVSSSTALEPKIVNHGNVFGTKNWYTFYCPHCGSQINNRTDTCEGSYPTKGCGGAIKWKQ